MSICVQNLQQYANKFNIKESIHHLPTLKSPLIEFRSEKSPFLATSLTSVPPVSISHNIQSITNLDNLFIGQLSK